MEFLVFIIYGIIMSEWIFGKRLTLSTTAKERNYHRTSGVLNMIVGFVGLMLVQLLLRDKGIIPVWSVWVGMIGFMIMIFIGMYHIYKMITTLNP